MKKIITLFVPLLIYSVIKAQCDQINLNADGKIYYSGIVESTNKSKDVLFSESLEWIAMVYKNPTGVTYFKDRDLGKIIIRGSSMVRYQELQYYAYLAGFFLTKVQEGVKRVDEEVHLQYALVLSVKDGRVKYEFYPDRIADDGQEELLSNYISFCRFSDDAEAQFRQAYTSQYLENKKKGEMIDGKRLLKLTEIDMANIELKAINVFADLQATIERLTEQLTDHLTTDHTDW